MFSFENEAVKIHTILQHQNQINKHCEKLQNIQTLFKHAWFCLREINNFISAQNLRFVGRSVA